MKSNITSTLRGLFNPKDRFFTRLDWAAFWTATIVTFAVYFYTLGPSVGLEDSGELATAAANLGVPHPPGYPFWTFCSWLFCKVFGWVTYMSHPTPAWCVSLFSATVGAFAAGCTAMLICRSSRDFVSGVDAQGDEAHASRCAAILAFGGGVGGALTFALSPVEWSQSTIVEIYSLNALFLMWVFLLSYRWMRKPSDKMLWFTAFVFGLGLTNYQVLVFAIVPLALIILMKNIRLFRDVAIFLIPVALTYQILQIGQLQRSDWTMSSDVIAKNLPYGVDKASWLTDLSLRTLPPNPRVYHSHQQVLDKLEALKPDLLSHADRCPDSWVIVLGLALVVAGILLAIWFARSRQDARRAVLSALCVSGGGALFMLLGSFVFTHAETWTGIYAETAPLASPHLYVLIASFLAGSAAVAAAAAVSGADFGDRRFWRFVGISAALALVALIAVACVDSAESLSTTYLGVDPKTHTLVSSVAKYGGAEYNWSKSILMFVALIVILFVLCFLTPKRKGLLFAIPVAAVQIAVFCLLKKGAMNGLTHPTSWWFCWVAAWNFILLALCWATLPNGRSVAGAAFFAQLGASFYAYMPIVSDLRNPPMNWGYPRTWEGFKHAILRGQYEAIGFQLPNWAMISNYFEDVKVQFTDVLIPFALVPIAAGHWIVRKENRKTFWQWMIPAFACFFVMSFLVIALAGVKGDLQDGFIQKVKFISSHAMLAMWIGYGLVFAGAYVLLKPRWGSLSGRMKRLFAVLLALAMIAVSLVYPLIDNYCGEYMLGVNEVAFKLGGSEQNGHTFGWQFGAYQLEGAAAINDQLVADEEPLPDPTWPPAMERSAVFFGGTDPGRFVPTYMIYSADYRPDVYLITQNALADDTYMSVERDLYGDEIWIPAKEDSAEAFNIYVDEVQRGVRQANGDLKIENGRVQVTGALGVMEINGILTKMMFDHDRTNRAFYVEESYVIPWMYDYLSPHGLIMKINADKKPYDPKTAARDADFWDWYTRRLTADPMYRRDFAGQKSFSKLRAAIAGLYRAQGRYGESAQAFREAVLLYPASPEATFRYAQECLLPFRKWDVVIDVLDYTDHVDPKNKRTRALRDYVVRSKTLLSEFERLSKLRAEGKMTPADAIAFASCLFEFGRAREAAEILRPLVPTVKDPNILRKLSIMLLDAHADSEAQTCLDRYVRVNGGDVDAWLDLALVRYRLKRVKEAQDAFLKAYKMNGKAATERRRRDRELYEYTEPLYQRRM